MAAILFLLLLIFTEFSISTAQQKTNTHISLGSSLSPNTNNSYWLSNSGQFAFGFYKTRDNGFAVGIWFQKINQKTVIWTANRDDPPLSNDVTLLLNSDGWLVLQDKQGQETTIIANSSQPAASASMLDLGNFVLYNSNSTIIWQSLDYPKDTLLPGQSLLAGKRLISADKRFRLAMQRDGNLVQYPAMTPATPYYSYWATNIKIKTGSNTSLNLDLNGHLYLFNSSGFDTKTIFSGGKNLNDKVLYRLTLDVDGILRLYSHSSVQMNSSWVIKWASVINKCAPVGLCGLNSYCVLKGGDDSNQEPDCACPPGFDFIDKQQRNLGCQRNSSADCITQNESHQSYEDPHLSFVELDEIAWSNENSYSVVSLLNKSACRDEMLRRL